MSLGGRSRPHLTHYSLFRKKNFTENLFKLLVSQAPVNPFHTSIDIRHVSFL